MNFPDSEWVRRLAEPTLLREEVHVWKAANDWGQKDINRLEHLLSPDELVRANKMHTERNRNQYVSSRVLLRTILARYLGVQPDQLRFCRNEHGKPFLASSGRPEVMFNMSHSGDLTVIAVCQNRAVGIDVEEAIPRNDIAKIARRFFSPKEYGDWQSLPEQEKLNAFYSCWTRKEAYIKALGKGVTFPLKRFSVSLNPGEKVEFLENEIYPDHARNWRLEDIDFGNGYCGALVVEGLRWDLGLFEASALLPASNNQRVNRIDALPN